MKRASTPVKARYHSAPAAGLRDFVYGVQPISRRLPVFSASEAAQEDKRFEARTFFSDGSRGYDLTGMTADEPASCSNSSVTSI